MKATILLFFIIFFINLKADDWMMFHSVNSPLPSNFIHDLLIDEDNTKWICTDSVIVRIKGDKFIITDTLINNRDSISFQSVAVDSSGNLWFTFFSDKEKPYSGIMHYNGFFFNIDTIFSDMKWIKQIEIDASGGKWIETSLGLLYMKDKHCTFYNEENSHVPLNDITNITININGEIWVATIEGICIYFDGVWKVINKANSKLPSNIIHNINVINQNLILLSSDEGLILFSKDVDTIYKSSDIGTETNSINVAEIDDLGNYWLGINYDYNSFVKYDGKSWKIFNPVIPTMLNLRYPWIIKIDKYGNKWIGMLFDGIAVYREGGVILSTEDNQQYTKDLKFSPNPFSSSTNINFTLPNPCKVKLKIYNTLGYEVGNLIDKYLDSGGHSAVFDGSALPSGAYFYVLQAGGRIESGKMILMKNE